MVITKEVNLPEFCTLNVEEINLSTVTLMAAAPYLGKHCEAVNNEFMLCRQETDDPRPCVDLGKKVTSCSMQLFKNIKCKCLAEFNQYANCVDKSSSTYEYKHCRKTQVVFDNCMKENLKMDRPDFGYFCKGRVHKSPSGALTAPACPCKSKVPDPTPSLPDCKPRPPARFTSRLYWMTE